MPRTTRVYTRTGDDGTTALGGGQRVRKDSLRIAAYGTVDELNSQIGVALSAGVGARLSAELDQIQSQLFDLGSDLCFLESEKDELRVPTIGGHHVEALERLMDDLAQQLEPLRNFVLPGGSPGAAQLHVARTICRRAERCVVALSAEESVGAATLPYLNRLADTLFVMARYENARVGTPEVVWKGGV